MKTLFGKSKNKGFHFIKSSLTYCFYLPSHRCRVAYLTFLPRYILHAYANYTSDFPLLPQLHSTRLFFIMSIMYIFLMQV